MAATSSRTTPCTLDEKKAIIAEILSNGRPVHLVPRYFGDPQVDEILAHFSAFGYPITPKRGHHIIHPIDGEEY